MESAESSSNELSGYFPQLQEMKIQQIIPAIGGFPIFKITPTQRLAHEQSRSFKQGIPEAWSEYWVFKPFVQVPSFRDIRCNIPYPNVQITEGIWRDFGLHLQQGIPDPLRTSPVFGPAHFFETLDEEENNIHPKNDEGTEISNTEMEDPDGGKIAQSKPRKNSVNQRKDFEKRNTDGEGKLHREEFKEGTRHLSIPQQLPCMIQNIKQEELPDYRKASWMAKVVKDMIRKFRNTRRMSSAQRAQECNVNFVCYHCNYPCFTICRANDCLGVVETKQMAGAHTGDDDDEKNAGRPAPGAFGISKRNKAVTAKMSISSNVSINNQESSATLVPSPTSGSIPAILPMKTSDRENAICYKESKDTVSSRASSERLKNHIYECFPPALKPFSRENIPGPLETSVRKQKYPLGGAEDAAMEGRYDPPFWENRVQLKRCDDSFNEMDLRRSVEERFGMLGARGTPDKAQQIFDGPRMVSRQLYTRNDAYLSGNFDYGKKVIDRRTSGIQYAEPMIPIANRKNGGTERQPPDLCGLSSGEHIDGMMRRPEH